MPNNKLTRRQRSQSMVEFAIVAPLLLLLIFGIVDFGRVIYVYITLNQAVDVHPANPCPNGPIPTATPPTNQGGIYITEPNPPSAVEALSPTLENAPGGQKWAFDNGTCSATNPAYNHAPLQVTIRYNFV